MAEETFVQSYIESGKYLQFTIDSATKLDGVPIQVHNRLESRTREGDVTDALRLRIHDPLWMLSRQYQMGEFRGNDAGVAMKVRCHVRERSLGALLDGSDANNTLTENPEMPIEPLVERMDRVITPYVRVESALYFLDLMKKNGCDAQQLCSLRNILRSICPLPENVYNPSSLDHEAVRDCTRNENTRLNSFLSAHRAYAFDGYLLYEQICDSVQNLVNKLDNLLQKESSDIAVGILGILQALSESPYPILATYRKWFQGKYLPIKGQKQQTWKTQQMGYDFKVRSSEGVFSAKDYSSGNVSWHSFDVDKNVNGQSKGESRDIIISTLPSLATFSGAPASRLWEFEDQKVFMGNSSEMQAKGNIAVMEYATMYDGDWMVVPLDTTIGKYITVDHIEVYDTFGVRSVIKDRAGSKDKSQKKESQKWQMFTSADANNVEGCCADGLFFPPSVMDTQESAPIEEIQILRDEMANMVWAVEERLEDGAGSTLDATLLAARVSAFCDERNEEMVNDARSKISLSLDENQKTQIKSDKSMDFKYVLQTDVPLNWIPLVVQHLPGKGSEYDAFLLGGRETILRRGKMPLSFLGKWYGVKPLTSILNEGIQENRETPLFINEEEVQQVGQKIIKTCQRSRWILGKTFQWTGIKTSLRQMQGSSGLVYDRLLEV